MMSEMDEMPEGAKWDGFPVFGRDRDGWHLLQFKDEEYPTPMWWGWRVNGWFTDPITPAGMPAEVAHETGYSYLAGTVTPADLKAAIAAAVAAEREKNAKACDALSGQWIKCHNPKLSDAQYWEGKFNAALDCAEAIRSAEK